MKKLFWMIFFLFLFGCQKEEEIISHKVYNIQYSFYCSQPAKIKYRMFTGRNRFGDPIFKEVEDNISDYKSLAFQGYEGYYFTEGETDDSLKIEITIDGIKKFSRKSYQFNSIKFNL